MVVRAAGVDTWAPCWRVDPESGAGLALDAVATEPSRRGRLLPQAIAGHRVLWHRPTGLLKAEGHPSPDGLAAPGELPAALGRLELALLEAGVPVPIGANFRLRVSRESDKASARSLLRLMVR